MPATTIKVPAELRDRINRDARARGVSAAALLADLLESHERAERFRAIREAYAQLPQTDDYAAETQSWVRADMAWPRD